MAKKAYIGVDGKARKVKKGYIGVENFVKRALPSGYTQLSHIESTGAQYFDTGFAPNQDTRVVCKAQYTDVSVNGALFGSRYGTNQQRYDFLVATPNFFSAYNTSGGTNKTASTDLLVIDKNKNTTTINGVVLSEHTYATFQTPCNMLLFAENTNGTVSLQAKAKVWDYLVYDNGTLIRDYVPCKNPSGVVGLYDMVNGTFGGSATSTPFVAGSSVQSVARKIKKAYIGIGGVAHCCFGGGVEDIVITYNGNMTDEIVTMSGSRYRLLTLTSSGTLTVDTAVNAEVWMCGGGTSGHHSGNSTPGGGGAGAFTKSGSVVLGGSTVAVIGAGGVSGTGTAASTKFGAGGATSFGGLATSTDFTRPYENRSSGVSGGTGGGNCQNSTISKAGIGDGVTKYPFGDTSYFNPHCAGGGAGAFYYGWNGGVGGTNGGNGGAPKLGSGDPQAGGAGGNYGGGSGGNAPIYGGPLKGGDATFYGSAGGGAGGRDSWSSYVQGGAGYQGVIYVRIKIA